MKTKRLFAAVVLAGNLSARLSAQDCDLILLHAAHDYVQKSETGSMEENVLNWMKSESFRDWARSRGGGLNLSIPGVVELGANANDNEVRKFQDSITQLGSSQFSKAHANFVLMRLVNRDALEAYNKCVETVTGGRSIRTSYTTNGNQIDFTIVWRPTDQNQQRPRLVSWTLLGGRAAPNALRPGDELTPNGKHLVCERNPGEPVMLLVSTTEGDVTAQIPSIPIAKPRSPEDDVPATIPADGEPMFELIRKLGAHFETEIKKRATSAKNSEQLRYQVYNILQDRLMLRRAAQLGGGAFPLSPDQIEESKKPITRPIDFSQSGFGGF